MHIPDHALLRNIPEFIPEFDGRKLHVRIGDSVKTENFYELKAKYSANRKERRKRDSGVSAIGGSALSLASRHAHLRAVTTAGRQN